MKIVFSSRAKTDLAEFVNFIAHDKPQAARKWAKNIRQSVLKLSDFPKMGRIVLACIIHKSPPPPQDKSCGYK